MCRTRLVVHNRRPSDNYDGARYRRQHTPPGWHWAVLATTELAQSASPAPPATVCGPNSRQLVRRISQGRCTRNSVTAWRRASTNGHPIKRPSQTQGPTTSCSHAFCAQPLSGIATRSLRLRPSRRRTSRRTRSRRGRPGRANKRSTSTRLPHPTPPFPRGQPR